jgi:putative membrane-bound dehydrogenase-like protein
MVRFSVLFALVFALTAQGMSVGVGKVDITPDYPIRLCGYALRKTESTGIEQHVYAKALALGDDDQLAMLITVDTTGVPSELAEKIAARIQTEAHVARERLVICSSHSHCAPCLTGYAPNIFGKPVTAEEQATIDKYTQQVADGVVKAALAAIADRKPGNLSWGSGQADFAANRRTKGGPVEHAVPLLLVTDDQGHERAIVANYACHCTTLGPDFNKICADWSGFAQAEIEKRHPGAMAMITIGCAGDANPMPRGTLDLAKQHGHEFADAVDQILTGKLAPLTEPLTTVLKRTTLPFEPIKRKDEWEALAKRPDYIGGNARIQLAKLNRGETLPTEMPYTAETWTFGNQLAMVFLMGEVVVDYDLRIKNDFDPSRLWISAYSNGVSCYIPSRRILTEGGYEAESNMVYYARPAKFAPGVENIVIELVHSMLPTSYRTAKSLEDFPLPLNVEESKRAFHLRDDLKVDLAVSEPLIASPVAIDWGLDGRLWVVEMKDYPNGVDENLTPGGDIKVLESTHHDGHYDKATVFLDHLRMPTGVMVWGKGVLICAAPDIIYAEDTKGTGKADLIKVLYTGFGPKNEQWLVNGLAYGLDNWIYGASSIANDPIHSTLTNQTIDLGNRDFRIHPETGALEPAEGRTQFCRPTDDFGNAFANDNSNLLWNYPLPEHYVARNPATIAPGQVLCPRGYDFNQLYPVARMLVRFNEPNSAGRTTSACGPAIYRDSLLPHDLYGNAFGCEPVHSMVYRLLTEPNGVTFSAHRAPEEQHSEFFASTDNWFRPVQVRTGPDGALWVVDMHRFVIEHPRWITPDRMMTLDVRAGADMGRIWRILPKDKEPQSIPDRSVMSTADLAAALDTDNGTVRDMIQRVLVERKDKSAVTPLESLVRKSTRAPVRLQALCTLDGLGAVSADLLQTALHDEHPGVRRQAVRISEPLLDREPAVLQALAQLAKDADETVRFQVALSLGESSSAEAARVIGDIAVKEVGDAWFRAAVSSSAVHQPLVILQTFIAGAPNSAQRDDLIAQLVHTGAAHVDHVPELVAIIAPKDAAQPWNLKALGKLVDAVQADDGSLPAEAKDAIAAARSIAADKHADTALRAAAIGLLARGSEPSADDLKLLAAFLQPQSLPELQNAALASLGRSRGPKPPAMLIAYWKTASPAQRNATLNLLVSRPEWTLVLLDAVEKNKVQLAEIPITTRVRILKIEDTTVHARAQALLSTTRPSTRQEILKQFESVGEMKGDATRGAAVFNRTCVSCHHLSNLGHAVGPDLSALTDRSPRALMIAILDPNAAVDGKYFAYDLQLRDGRVLSGIITSETASSVTLLQPTALSETISRSDLVKLRNTGLSLMPEGLEAGMSKQDLADLISFVAAAKPSKP